MHMELDQQHHSRVPIYPRSSLYRSLSSVQEIVEPKVMINYPCRQRGCLIPALLHWQSPCINRNYTRLLCQNSPPSPHPHHEIFRPGSFHRPVASRRSSADPGHCKHPCDTNIRDRLLTQIQWQTTWNRGSLFADVSPTTAIDFTTPGTIGAADIVVDDSTIYQTMVGFGATLSNCTHTHHACSANLATL